MLAATILHSLSAVCVLLIVIGFGVFLARKGWFDAPSHRGIVSKLVNAALPCFLFYSVISKFSHGELYNLLKFAGLPFANGRLELFDLRPIHQARLGSASHERNVHCRIYRRDRFVRRRPSGTDNVRLERNSLFARLLLCQLRLHLDRRHL